MNHLVRWSRSLLAVLASLAWTPLAWAQTQGGDVGGDVTSTTTTTSVWYGQWWIWALAVGVFLIVVIALTNRGGRSAT